MNHISEESFSHEQVFGDLEKTLFSVAEAAEYLDVSIATLNRFVSDNQIKPAKIETGTPFFAANELSAFKRSIKPKA